MTSITACGFHEPALLLHEPGSRTGGSRGNAVIRRSAEESDGALRIEAAQFLSAHMFQRRTRVFPDLRPAFAEGDLLGCPIRET